MNAALTAATLEQISQIVDVALRNTAAQAIIGGRFSLSAPVVLRRSRLNERIADNRKRGWRRLLSSTRSATASIC